MNLALMGTDSNVHGITRGNSQLCSFMHLVLQTKKVMFIFV